MIFNRKSASNREIHEIPIISINILLHEPMRLYLIVMMNLHIVPMVERRLLSVKMSTTLTLLRTTIIISSP
jgi:hypothetical protein